MPPFEKIPMVFSDKVNAASAVVYVPEIHWVLDFDGALDKIRLKRALRLLLDAEPVLGCRLRERWVRPFWHRLPAAELDAAKIFRELHGEVNRLEDAARTFYGTPVNAARGPQVRALLLHRSEGDRLIIKINHCTCDAGGFKEVLYRLAGIYRSLAQDPDYIPEPRTGPRGLWQVYRRFSLPQLLAIYFKGMGQILRLMWPPQSFQYPSGKRAEGPLLYTFKHFSRERVAEISAYARQHGATINDLIVTAVVRAMTRQTGWQGKGSLRLVGTVDLRRHLPQGRTGALCQVSGMYSVYLGKTLEKNYEETLRRVKAIIDKDKSRYFGLGMFLNMIFMFNPLPYFLFKTGLGAFWRLGLWDGNLPPGLTNLGRVDPLAANFESPNLTSAVMTIPATNPPWFGTGLSGFAGTLTFSAGFYPTAISAEKIKAFFALLDEELPGGRN